MVGSTKRSLHRWLDATAGFVTQPIIADAIAVALAALAFSGKFSMTLTNVLLGISWIMVFLGTRHYSLRSRFTVRALSFTLFIFLALWARTEPAPQDYGELIGKNSPAYNDDVTAWHPRIQIGNSGVFIEDEAILAGFLEKSHLSTRVIDGKLAVSVTITDKNGVIIAKIIDNEWKISPPPNTWDRNYTKDALEVIDQYGNVSLQLRLIDNRVQIQGMWWIIHKGETCLLIIRGDETNNNAIFSLVERNTPPTEWPKIPAIFRYPSTTHMGEMVTMK